MGEESHDDILPSDDEADIANRILGPHARRISGRRRLERRVGIAAEHRRARAGARARLLPGRRETLARYVREIDYGHRPPTPARTWNAPPSREPAFRTSFRIRAMAGADPEDEPPSTRSSGRRRRLPAT